MDTAKAPSNLPVVISKPSGLIGPETKNLGRPNLPFDGVKQCSLIDGVLPIGQIQYHRCPSTTQHVSILQRHDLFANGIMPCCAAISAFFWLFFAHA